MTRSKVTLVLARKQVKKKQKYFFHTMYEHSTCWHLNCQLSRDHDPIQVRQQKQNTKTKQKTETTTCFVFLRFSCFLLVFDVVDLLTTFGCSFLGANMYEIGWRFKFWSDLIYFSLYFVLVFFWSCFSVVIVFPCFMCSCHFSNSN